MEDNKKTKILDSLQDDKDTEDALSDLLEGTISDDEKKETIEEEPAIREVPKPTAKEDTMATVSSREKISPLEKMQQDKASGKLQTGMVVSNEKLLEGMIQHDKVLGIYSDERLSEWDEAIAELDDEINKRQYVTVVRAPQNKFEYMVMMDELSSLKIVDGKPVLDFKDKDGNPLNLHYLRVRKEGEPEFDFSELASFDSTEKKDPSAPAQSTPDMQATINTEEMLKDKEESSEPEELDEDGRKTVTILIDKTGFGANFDFDEEDQKKISLSDEIHVKEISNMQLQTMIGKKSERSFSDIKALRYDFGRSTGVTICFPASGFKAKMKGLTYGQYTELVLAMDSLTFDNYRKQLTVVYNNMTDISIGEFKDFDDFLQHFASADLSLAIYGMFVATEPEDTSMELQCQNPTCKNNFIRKYNPRALLRLERCPKEFLDGMERVASANPTEYMQIHNNSPVMTSKYIQMEDTGWVVELGVASAYHVLYNYLPISTEEGLKEAFGEKDFETHFLNLNMLSGVRKIHIPDPESDPNDPEWIHCDTYKDLMPALYDLPPKETQLLRTYVSDIDSIYIPAIGLVQTTCPHCHTLSEFIPISLDELVFIAYRRLVNTKYSLDGSVRN